MRRLAAGNWKMNGTRADLEVLRGLAALFPAPAADILVCPPATLLAKAAQTVAGSAVKIGAQDCHPEIAGAHTGDISAEMLAEAGATAVIIGHSERRADHGEDNALIRAKVAAAHRAGLTAILCLGETLADRDSGHAERVVAAQLDAGLPDAATPDNTVIAYEPVWAIGTGRTAETADIAAMHTALRDRLRTQPGIEAARMRLLYGGSVKPGNAAEIFAVPGVDGALVGGASLQQRDFAAIMTALEAAG